MYLFGTENVPDLISQVSSPQKHTAETEQSQQQIECRRRRVRVFRVRVAALFSAVVGGFLHKKLYMMRLRICLRIYMFNVPVYLWWYILCLRKLEESDSPSFTYFFISQNRAFDNDPRHHRQLKQ